MVCRIRIAFCGCILAAGIIFAAPLCAQEVLPAAAPPVGTVPPVASGTTDIDKILQDEQLRIGLQEAFQRKSKLRAPDVDLSALHTVLFSLWQHELLQEAKMKFVTRAPDASELQQGETGAPPVKGVREIGVGGIAWRNVKEWTVWLNGQRITPDAIPKEVMDIRVKKDYVELKWFDSYTNLIFPVRLRPHQRFNLDSRIFLPGESNQ